MVGQDNSSYDPDTEGLPPDDLELAFFIYEKRLRARTRDAANTNDDSYDIEREYVNKLLAFIELAGTKIPVNEEPPFENVKFSYWYNRFLQQVDRFTARVGVARGMGIGPGIVTALHLSDDYRTEISGLIGRIRKVINASDIAVDKKEAIYKKIAALQLEVDTTMTSVGAFCSRLLEVTHTVGEAAENLEPVAKMIERIWKTFSSAQADHKRGELPAPTELRQITGSTDTEDDIPF
jgi:hypothetical protein